ncbi:MAG TPA: DUF58 domain-containing protein [Pirellulales bacterium]|jgi:uncharacterized protein (DUF58 family)|nr:DUF58 domain-containing protein [Pirellulales bacterium]
MRWFAGAVLILLFSLAFGLGLLTYAMYALLGIMLVSRVLSRVWIESLAAQRECNRLSASIGDRVAVNISVQNRGAIPIAWLLMEDLLPIAALIYKPPNLGVEGRRLQLLMLRSRGRGILLYTLQCNRRGYYQIGPLVLETGDLFGLHRRYRVATEPHFLLVYPQVIPLSGYDIASRRPIGEIRLQHRLYEDPTRIGGVRRYEAGDPMNRVHWRATARTGVLHSKVYEASTIAGATLLLDFHKDSYAAKDEPYRSELAITATASLANSVYEMGQQIGFICNGRDAADRIRQEGWSADDYRTRSAARKAAGMLEKSDRLQPLVIPTRRGPEQLMQILQTLARAELTDGFDFAHLVTETISRMPRDATVVAILPTASAATILALQMLHRRGFAVSAILNFYDDYEFGVAAATLTASGISVQHLKDEVSVTDVCRQFALR